MGRSCLNEDASIEEARGLVGLSFSAVVASSTGTVSSPDGSLSFAKSRRHRGQSEETFRSQGTTHCIE